MTTPAEQGGELQRRSRPPVVERRTGTLGVAGDHIDSLGRLLDGLQAVPVEGAADPEVLPSNLAEEVSARAAEIAIQRGNNDTSNS